MFRAHLAAAVLLGAALMPSAAQAFNFNTMVSYWSSWNLGGSWETIPAEFVQRYDTGYESGYPIGYRTGFGEGQVRGRSEGWAKGKAAGHSAGWDEAYPLAFALAFDAAYPGGHRAGWETGVGEGFQEGYDYAPVVAAILSDRYGGGGYASGGNVFLSNFNLETDTILNSGITVWKNAYDTDWSKLAYDEGFKVGRTAGYSAGSMDGYNDTYRVTYDQAFPIGHQLGIWEGTSTGKREGGTQGHEEGFVAGYDLGFDEGFYAGIDYRLFGTFAEPHYALQYSRRSNASTATTLLAMNAPEPGSALLLAVGGAIASVRARRLRLPQSV